MAANDNQPGAHIIPREVEDAIRTQLMLNLVHSEELDLIYSKCVWPISAARHAEILAEQGVLRIQAGELARLGHGCSTEALTRIYSVAPLSPKHFKKGYVGAFRDEVIADVYRQRNSRVDPEIISRYEQAGVGFKASRCFRHAEKCFRHAKNEYESIGADDEAGSAYVDMMSARRDWLRQTRALPVYLGYTLWMITCKFGESAMRWLVWIIAVTVFFGIMYLPAPSLLDGFSLFRLSFSGSFDPSRSWEDAFMISALSFFLGLPTELQANNQATKMVLVLESLVGYVMFALLLSIVDRWVRRR